MLLGLTSASYNSTSASDDELEVFVEYPDVGYEAVLQDDRLQLRSFDGSVRMVTFETPAAARLALKPGRAELDCVAIINGFLPLGARHVSQDAARCEPDSARSKVQRAGSASGDADGYIDRGRNALARRHNPVDSNRYDDITGDMALRAIGNEHAASARAEH